MTENAKVGILINNRIIEVNVYPSTTVLDLIKYIRNRFDLSIFESLEIKYQGKTLSPDSSVFTASFSKGKVVFECNRRKLFGGI